MFIKPPLPRWDCHDEKDQERLEAWTNARLDSIDDTAADPKRDPFHIFDPTVAVLEQDIAQRLKRGRVKIAARAGHYETVARLADTVELRRLALSSLDHRRGREIGDQRPNDLPQTTKRCCEEALADVEHIRQIWKTTYGKRNRSASPTAMEIAARRWGIDDTLLINFKKNRNRRKSSDR